MFALVAVLSIACQFPNKHIATSDNIAEIRTVHIPHVMHVYDYSIIYHAIIHLKIKATYLNYIMHLQDVFAPS